MIESFNTLQKGDVVYILNLEDYSVKTSIVVESDNTGIYTQHKDFLKEKIGGKINYKSIKDGKEYCTIDKQELQNELVWLKNKIETDMQDLGFMIHFFEKHKEDPEQCIDDMKSQYSNDKISIDRIQDSIDSL